MPYRTLTIASVVLLLLVLFLPGSRVQAVPLLPSSFYGKVLVNNAPVADGTEVQALVNGQVVASSLTQPYQGSSYYSLSVPSDDTQTAGVEGGREGDIVQFKVGGLAAVETGTWHSGTNVELNLTVTAAATPVPPQPTRTPLPTQTPIQVIVPSSTATLALVLPSATWTVEPLSPTMTQTSQVVIEETEVESVVPSTPVISRPAEATSTVQTITEANPASQARRKAQTLAVGIILLAAAAAAVLVVRSRIIRNQK